MARMMRNGGLLTLAILAACGGDGGQANVQARRADLPAAGPAAEVARPVEAAPSDFNDVIGATPGPCGSTRATAFLGQTYRPEMDAEMMRVSGATAIRRIRPTGEDAGSGEIVDRRMNVVLNDFGQIIMLDCG